MISAGNAVVVVDADVLEVLDVDAPGAVVAVVPAGGGEIPPGAPAGAVVAVESGVVVTTDPPPPPLVIVVVGGAAVVVVATVVGATVVEVVETGVAVDVVVDVVVDEAGVAAPATVVEEVLSAPAGAGEVNVRTTMAAATVAVTLRHRRAASNPFPTPSA